MTLHPPLWAGGATYAATTGRTDASTQPSDPDLIQPGPGRQILADQAAAAAEAQATQAEAHAAAGGRPSSGG